MSDPQNALSFPLTCAICKILVKNKNKFWASKAQLSGHKFSLKSTFLFLYTHSNSHENFTSIDSVWEESSHQKASKKSTNQNFLNFKSNFSKTVRFWKKMYKNQSGRAWKFWTSKCPPVFSRAHCWGDIWEKQEKTLNYESSTFRAQIYFKNYTALSLYPF